MRITGGLCCLLLGLALLFPWPVSGADSLSWRSKQDQVDAEIQAWDLQMLLTKLATQTGWQIYYEPGSKHVVSVKFKNLSTDQALRRLLGDISYSLTQSNGSVQLFVYQTSAKAATQRVNSENPEAKSKQGKDYRIANELVIRLKPNSKLTIEELARLTNGKIVGRNDALHFYRVQFPDEASAKAARELLEKNDSVAWVDSNYSVDRPDPVNKTAAQANTQFKIDPKAPTDRSGVIGLIDTSVQVPPGMEKFALKAVSVVGDLPTTEADSGPTHGTAMFETMLQAMSDDSAKVLSVVVYKNGETTSTYEVAQGIIQAINHGANPINLSLGGTGDSAFLKQLIAEASAKGFVFVAAAGNEPVKTPTYPAAYPGVYSVTAADENGHIAPYANYGDFVKAMAPGTSVVMANGQLWQFQGTSVAAAYVSGMLGAKAAANGTPLTQQMAQSLISTLPVK